MKEVEVKVRFDKESRVYRDKKGREIRFDEDYGLYHDAKGRVIDYFCILDEDGKEDFCFNVTTKLGGELVNADFLLDAVFEKIASLEKEANRPGLTNSERKRILKLICVYENYVHLIMW